MLEQARDKVLSRTSRRGPNSSNHPQYAFLQGDSAHLDDLPDHAFDTVIDTFGLCSYDDPVAVIQEMIRKCKRRDEDGILIFIEHGRSKTWSFITQHLDKHAEQHAANWGCVWNRDLDEIIQTVSTRTTDTIVLPVVPTPSSSTTTTSDHNSNPDIGTKRHQNNNTDNATTLSSTLSMEIIHLQTFHFGTTYVIVARPTH
jgi:hypothetical protein